MIEQIRAFCASSGLSAREVVVVVKMVTEATDTTAIAKSLKISTHTVNNHLKSIFQKTKAGSKSEVLRFFILTQASAVAKGIPEAPAPSGTL